MFNRIEWVKSLLERKDAGKVLPILSYPGGQLIGASIGQLVKDSKLQAMAMKAVAERTNSAASVSFMDLSVEAECFGAQLVFSDDEVPTVTHSVVTSPEEIDSFEVPAVSSCRAPVYVEAVRIAKNNITDRPVFAGVIGPFSLAGRLLDVNEAMFYCYDEPEALKRLLDKTTRFLENYINEYKRAGADGVVVAEPLAGLLSPEFAERFSEPFVRRLAQLQEDNFIVIYHNCGNETVKMLPSILRTGCSCYHFGNAVDMGDVLAGMPSDVIAMGNIDPAGQFCNGSEESVYRCTKQLMERLCDKYPNFVISSGCDIPYHADWKNIQSFFNAVSDYYNGK